jgi:hypothetical protein
MFRHGHICTSPGAANTLKFFPVSTGADFRDMLLVIAASPPDAAKPTKFDEFVAAHPTVPGALATAPTPDSFADEEYHGINAFVFINDKGERRAVRYIMSPEKLVHLDAAEAATMGPDYLVDELHCTTREVVAFGLDRIDPERDIRILLIEAAKRVLSELPDRISAATLRLLNEMGVEVRTGARVIEVTADGCGWPTACSFPRNWWFGPRA